MEEEKKARTTAKAQFTEGSLLKVVSSEADKLTMLRRYEDLKSKMLTTPIYLHWMMPRLEQKEIGLMN